MEKITLNTDEEYKRLVDDMIKDLDIPRKGYDPAQSEIPLASPATMIRQGISMIKNGHVSGPEHIMLISGMNLPDHITKERFASLVNHMKTIYKHLVGGLYSEYAVISGNSGVISLVEKSKYPGIHLYL